MKACLTLLILLVLLGPLNAGAQEAPRLNEAVELYRQGKYLEAEPLLSLLHHQRPEDSIATYYLAMTEAQLGRFDQARTLYEAVVLLNPQDKTADLAREGLKYLPERTADNLDLPPRFERPEAPAAATSTPAAPTTPNNNLSPQDLMMMQMMIGQQGGGMNPMLFGMMGQQQPGAEGGMLNNMDPNVMSTLMMNQMMQNFNLMGDDNNDRN